MKGKNFSIHLNYMVQDRQHHNIRISLSNIYKEPKVSPSIPVFEVIDLNSCLNRGQMDGNPSGGLWPAGRSRLDPWGWTVLILPQFMSTMLQPHCEELVHKWHQVHSHFNAEGHCSQATQGWGLVQRLQMDDTTWCQLAQPAIVKDCEVQWTREYVA